MRNIFEDEAPGTHEILAFIDEHGVCKKEVDSAVRQSKSKSVPELFVKKRSGARMLRVDLHGFFADEAQHRVRRLERCFSQRRGGRLFQHREPIDQQQPQAEDRERQQVGVGARDAEVHQHLPQRTARHQRRQMDAERLALERRQAGCPHRR